MVSPVKDEAWIDWITRLMGESPTPAAAVGELPPSAFYCLLDEQPTHLVLRRLLLTHKSTAADELVLNPTCLFSHGAELPDQLAGYADLIENFALQGNIVWLTNSATGALVPFWLGAEFSNLLSDLQPGDAAPRNLPDHARFILEASGLLVRRDTASRQRKKWSEYVLRCRERFARKFVPVSGLIHPFHLGALRRYYRRLVRNGRIPLGDDQSPRRYGAHNESVARFFHHQLTAAVSEIVGEPVKPSYVYFCSYLSGSDLEKHTDREQCEFTITFCLDFSPEPVAQTPWPLHVDADGAKITIYQGLGDGLLFCGRELPHYRYPLPAGQTSTSLFFHYVKQGFTGSPR